jgi:hypothetical protein
MQIVHLPLCLALALSAEAFAPSMPSRFSSTVIHAVKDKPLTELLEITKEPCDAVSPKPLTELLEITKEACDAVSPMLNGTLRVWLLFVLFVTKKGKDPFINQT